MLRHIGRTLSGLFFVLCLGVLLCSCATAERTKAQNCIEEGGDYGELESSVRELARAKVAMYGSDQLPPDLTAEKFIKQAYTSQNLPESRYETLQEFDYVFIVDGKNYILKIYNPQTGCLVMYDCSCSRTYLDGPVYQQPGLHAPNITKCKCQ